MAAAHLLRSHHSVTGLPIAIAATSRRYGGAPVSGRAKCSGLAEGQALPGGRLVIAGVGACLRLKFVWHRFEHVSRIRVRAEAERFPLFVVELEEAERTLEADETEEGFD